MCKKPEPPVNIDITESKNRCCSINGGKPTPPPNQITTRSDGGGGRPTPPPNQETTKGGGGK